MSTFLKMVNQKLGIPFTSASSFFSSLPSFSFSIFAFSKKETNFDGCYNRNQSIGTSN
jgi:hypothetical protein